MRRRRRRLLIATAIDIALLLGLWAGPQFVLSGRSVSLTSAYTLLAYLMFGTALLLLLALVLGIAIIVLTVKIRNGDDD